MIRIPFVLVSTVLAMIAISSGAEDITAESMSIERADALQLAWRVQRDQRIGQLLDILKDDNTPFEGQMSASVLLAELRAESAIPWLIQHIDKEYHFGVRYPAISRTFARKDAYPCVRLLTQIGKESSRQAATALRDEGNTLRRELLVDVIVGVEGPVAALLILELERLTCQQAKAVASAQRIEQALKTLYPEWGMQELGYPLLSADSLPRTEDFERQ